MTAAQGAAEHGQVFDVFVHHLISESAHLHPSLCGLNQSKLLSLVQIVDGRAGCFCQGALSSAGSSLSPTVSCSRPNRLTKASSRSARIGSVSIFSASSSVKRWPNKRRSVSSRCWHSFSVTRDKNSRRAASAAATLTARPALNRPQDSIPLGGWSQLDRCTGAWFVLSLAAADTADE